MSESRGKREAISLRRYRDGDERAINDAFNRVFGLERGLDDWGWKFPPGPGERRIAVAEDAGGAIVAHYAAVPVAFQFDGRRIEAGQVVDAFSVRRVGLTPRSIFVRLVRTFFDELCAPDKLAILFGFPGVRHAELGRLKLDYGRQIPIDLWTRTGAPHHHRRGLRRYELRRGLDRAMADRLWERSAARYLVATVRDGALLERRFSGRPGVEYVHLTVMRRGEPHACGVLRVDGETLSFAELIWDGRESGALRELDRAVAAEAEEAGVERSELWLANDVQAAEILTRGGWSAREHPAGLARQVASWEPAIDPVEVARRLYITMGDGDLV